jgi:hypothetical protein
VVPHVQFGRVQKSFEFESTSVAICYHITHLTDDSGENEHTNEVTGDREYVPAFIGLKFVIIICNSYQLNKLSNVYRGRSISASQLHPLLSWYLKKIQ